MNCPLPRPMPHLGILNKNPCCDMRKLNRSLLFLITAIAVGISYSTHGTLLKSLRSFYIPVGFFRHIPNCFFPLLT